MKTSLWRRPAKLSLLGQVTLLVVLLNSCLSGCQLSWRPPPPIVTPTSKPIPAAPASTSSPIPTLGPTPPPLYQANWSGGLGSSGWKAIGTGEWSVQDGQLISNGNLCCLIVVPYSPPSPNYAVSVTLKVRAVDPSGDKVFGILLRAQQVNESSPSGYIAGVSHLNGVVSGTAFIGNYASGSLLGDSVSYSSDGNWHTYTFAVHGTDLKLFATDITNTTKLLHEAHDTAFQSAGQLALFGGKGIQLTVKSYVVSSN